MGRSTFLSRSQIAFSYPLFSSHIKYHGTCSSEINIQLYVELMSGKVGLVMEWKRSKRRRCCNRCEVAMKEVEEMS